MTMAQRGFDNGLFFAYNLPPLPHRGGSQKDCDQHKALWPVVAVDPPLPRAFVAAPGPDPNF